MQFIYFLEIYTTNLLKMDLNNPKEKELVIPDVARVSILPLFEIDYDSAEESMDYNCKNVVIMTFELQGRAKEECKDTKVELLTAVRNTGCNQKCCVYKHSIQEPPGEEENRVKVCVGYSYEMLEYFKVDGAIFECEVCFYLSLPDNCVRIE